MNSSRAIRVFGPRAEAVSLILPFLFFALIAYEWKMEGPLDPWSRSVWHLVANVLFLNTLHVIFTFEMAFTLPEYRRVLASRARGPAFLFLGAVALILIGLKYAETSWTGSGGRFASVLVVAIVARHALKQNLGISLLYNVLARRSGILAPAQVQRLDTCETRERFYFKALIAMMVGRFALTQVRLEAVEAVLPAVTWAFTFLGVAMTLRLAAMYYFAGGVLLRGKSIFFARLLLMISSFHSYLGLIGFNFVHGVEYYLVYKRVQTHRRPEPAFVFARGLVLVLGLTVVAGAVFDPASGVFGLFGLSAWNEMWLVKAAVVVTGGLVFFITIWTSLCSR